MGRPVGVRAAWVGPVVAERGDQGAQGESQGAHGYQSPPNDFVGDHWITSARASSATIMASSATDCAIVRATVSSTVSSPTVIARL